jgi:hypothetical protein
VGLKDAPEIVKQISVSAELGKQLGCHFHKNIRLSGVGKWKRCSSGLWALEILEADRFDVLEDEPLDALMHGIRKLIRPGETLRSIELLRDLN